MSARTTSSLLRLGVLAAATTLALSGCAGNTASVPSGPQSASFSATDTWVKAVDSGMTAAFGTLTNSGDRPLTISSVTSPLSAHVEMHETVQNESGQNVMREVEGGFVVPAHGALLLAPGGDHLMFMGVATPVRVGDEATVTLTFSDASTAEITAPVKQFAGANENYQGHDMHDMDMGH